jgi:CheY-like chemotaxis protein
VLLEEDGQARYSVPMVLALVQDLFFAARIRETARQLGLAFEAVRDPADLAARAAASPPRIVIVDMSARAGDPAAAVRALRADPRTRGLFIVGYLFDAHEDLIRVAREAGCDRVLSRGGLTKKLPDLLARQP